MLIGSATTGTRAISARGLLLQIDAEFVHVRFFFFGYSWESQNITAATGQTDLGKTAQLFSSLRGNLDNIRNNIRISDLTELYSDSIIELCKKCNILTAI